MKIIIILMSPLYHERKRDLFTEYIDFSVHRDENEPKAIYSAS